MNKKRIIVMLTILLVTVLSASSFYMIEKGIDPLSIFVNSYTVGESSGDFEKVYGDSHAPYEDSKGKYFIRYNGKATKRTVVDLGKSGAGLTLSSGKIMILNTEITSTYKMFMQSKSLTTYVDVTRVFVPSVIAIEHDGISANTFSGTTQEIDCIYHTGNILLNDDVQGNNGETITVTDANARGMGITASYDKTNKIKNNNVTLYVYLGNENVSRNDNVIASTVNGYNYSYRGTIKNVFLSNTLDYPTLFFSHGIDSDGTLIEYALLDDGKTWVDNKMGLGGVFYKQTNLKITSNFKMPSQVYQGSGGNYNENGLLLMFRSCSSISNLPSDFKIPEGVTNISGMFYNCYELRGIIELPNSIKWLDNLNDLVNEYFLGGAGIRVTDSSRYPTGYNTPIVVKYPVLNRYIDKYSKNVYTPQNTDGKVYMVPITNHNDTTNWEKVYEIGAPYYDENGAYYIRYKGNETTLDVGKEENDIELSAGTKHSCVLNTKLYSTYKMFSKGTTGEEIKRVFIPSNIAIDGDKETAVLQDDGTYTFDENKGIASNTFSGYENSNVEKDVIYHTGNILTEDETKDARGEGATSLYDRTAKISKNTYSHITTYVYLGNENVTRNENVISSTVASYNYSYHGAIKNIFIGNTLDYPTLFFSHGTDSDGTLIEYALLDDGKTWVDSQMGLGGLFYRQTNLKITSNFKMPSQIYQGSGGNYNENGLLLMFRTCSSITNLPSDFKIPEGVTNISGMFYNCYKLRGIIELPSSINRLDNIGNEVFEYFLGGAGIRVTDSSQYPSGYNTPIVVRYHSGCTVAEEYRKNVYMFMNEGDTDGTIIDENGKVTMVCISGISNQNSLISNDVAIASGDMISDNQDSEIIDEVDNTNSIQENATSSSTESSKSMVIEAETDSVTIIVNKKTVDEVFDETQETSQSVETVGENKSEEDEVQE